MPLCHLADESGPALHHMCWSLTHQGKKKRGWVVTGEKMKEKDEEVGSVEEMLTMNEESLCGE